MINTFFLAYGLFADIPGLKAPGFTRYIVNGNFRIIFRFEEGEAQDVDYLDYH